ncbi:hypothetical protein [Leptolyngbya sp. FACHB-261]|uniref:hypothetical protein n=1 Tax=Leptolyngbya sp. FACHB-261 TaxID=2692806 RepID=UPI00168336D7|nr:hypothetical protein [Leptolyngbya sp. FACHB-261]MBD2104605.1 hypothetical protein [Leptolyngbya sp. FACHB-261]
MGLASTISSPIAWQHHYGILLALYAFLLPYLWRRPLFGKLTIPYLGLSCFLSSNYFAFLKRAVTSPFNLVLSYLLLAALMVLVCLYALRRAEARPKRETFEVG